MLQPAAIDGLAFARNAAVLEGRLGMESLPRLAQSGCSGSVLDFVLTGEINERGKPGLMLAVDVAGLLVNIAAFAILHGGDRGNINVRGATLHVLGDMLGSIAAIAAAVVIALTGWMPIDPLLSVAVAGLVLHSAWGLVRASAHILLEGAPDWLDVAAFRAEMMAAVPGITDVHHIHTWMITADRPMITLHVEVEPGADHHTVLASVRAHIRDNVGIEHATIQIETAGCPDGPGAGPGAGPDAGPAAGEVQAEFPPRSAAS